MVFAHRAPEIEGRLAPGEGDRVDRRHRGLVDQHRHGAGALGGLAGVAELVERHVGGGDQGRLATGGARELPFERLAQRQGAAVAGVLDLVGAHGAGEPELVGHPGRERTAHVDRRLGADGDETDALQVPLPVAERPPGGLDRQLHHAVPFGAQGHLAAAQAEGVLRGVLAAQGGEILDRQSEGREAEADGGDARRGFFVGGDLSWHLRILLVGEGGADSEGIVAPGGWWIETPGHGVTEV